MKSNIYTFLLITIFSLLASSCKKQEPLIPEPPKVVNVNLNGSTSKDIEVFYNGKVIASQSASDNFSQFVKVPINNESTDLEIREKGATNVIAARSVKVSPFDQNIGIYYDGEEIYSQQVNYQIKGYAMSGELEFLLDGRIIHEGSTAIEKNQPVPINENSTRKLEVRKKGTTTALITKTIEPLPATGQFLGFFFDGESMVDNVQVNPPANPANMAVNVQFKSTVVSPLPAFVPGDLDIVFYTRNKTNNVITRTSPEIRIPLASDGSFTAFELPPLPGANFEYKFDIYKRGADNLPYDASASPAKILEANQGRNGTAIAFAAGESRLFLINDNMTLLRSPNRYVPWGVITDLSQYFQ